MSIGLVHWKKVVQHIGRSLFFVGGENVESQSDLTYGDEGERTVRVTSQRLWMIV